MIYNILKILHILSATLFLTGFVYSCRLWFANKNNINMTINRIQTQTWALIIPFGIFQLASGFTMISLKHYHLTELWVLGSIIGFIIVIVCWFGFLYSLFSQQSHFNRRLQFTILTLGGITLLSMLFLMANKITD